MSSEWQSPECSWAGSDVGVRASPCHCGERFWNSGFDLTIPEAGSILPKDKHHRIYPPSDLPQGLRRGYFFVVLFLRVAQCLPNPQSSVCMPSSMARICSTPPKTHLGTLGPITIHFCSRILLRPKLCLGRNIHEALLRLIPNPSSSKLEPACEIVRRAKRQVGTRAKRSFADMRSQAELGTEGKPRTR